MTLQDLVEAFPAARTAMVAIAEPYTPDRRICRYCGKHWQKYTGSALDGHAKCIVTGEYKALVKRALELDATLTYKRVADALGVSAAVVRAWTFPTRGAS